MSKKTKDTELMRQALADDPAAYESGWHVDDRPAFEDREPEVLVSRSLRLSITTYQEVSRIAGERGLSPSTLMRQWIEDGLAAAQEDDSRPTDPVSLVDRVQTDVARLAKALHRAA
jgi:hypothetical protein